MWFTMSTVHTTCTVHTCTCMYMYVYMYIFNSMNNNYYFIHDLTDTCTL